MPAYYLEIIVVVLGLTVLMVETFVPLRDKRSLAWLAILGLLGVLVLNFTAVDGSGGDTPFWDFYTADVLALWFKGIALLTTILVILMSVDFSKVLSQGIAPDADADESAKGKQVALGEFFALPIFICAGLMWMASANHLVSIFVALETVTIGFYVMVAFMRRNVGSLEAGVKYLILGALSTGFLVYGFAWLFGVTGSMELPAIAEALNAPDLQTTAALFAFALILIALCFKVGAVPFQLWIPDVYQGAPMPVTAFLSVGSKAAGFVILLRLVEPFMASTVLHDKVTLALVIIAGATIIYGNLAAMPQSNFKRLLAYSSVSHAGFLLMAVASAPTQVVAVSPVAAVAYYLAAYLMMTMLAFLIMNLVRVQRGGENLDDYKGLARTSPFLAFAMLVAMASLAGVPLTAGFVGKFFVFVLALQAGHYYLVGAAVIGAAAGFYYYLKVVKAMYWDAPAEAGEPAAAAITVTWPTRAAIILLLLAIFYFGVNPKCLLSLFS
ncbi:MAG: NADH-quinone oxidoreductase subunit N [Verrucomicrobiales bacterium]|nr:NADH-quinone oxidoreductase subunit N [Verrucomicrobiales bacterium]